MFNTDNFTSMEQLHEAMEQYRLDEAKDPVLVAVVDLPGNTRSKTFTIGDKMYYVRKEHTADFEITPDKAAGALMHGMTRAQRYKNVTAPTIRKKLIDAFWNTGGLHSVTAGVKHTK